MSTLTSFLQLIKPAVSGELVKVADFNTNFDTIDANALNHNGRISTLESEAGIIPWTDYVTEVRDDTSPFDVTFTKSRWYRIGSRVTIDVAGTINDWSTTDSSIRVRLPFRAENVSGAAKLITNGLGKIHSNVGTPSIHDLGLYIVTTTPTQRDYMNSGYLSSISVTDFHGSDTVPFPSVGGFFSMYGEYEATDIEVV